MYAHSFSFVEIVAYFVYILRQYILYYAPIVKPDAVGGDPPRWWLWFYEYYWYYTYLDEEQRPTAQWLDYYRRGILRVLGMWIEEEAEEKRDAAIQIVESWTGRAREGFPRLEDWIASIRSRVGSFVPSFASDLADAAQRLYYLLPEDVRTYVRTWAEKLHAVQDEVWGWVVARYDDARQFAIDARDWISRVGDSLDAWYNSVRATVDEFVSDPRGFITSRLGAAWTRLRQFEQMMLDYYVAVWSDHAETLSEFLSDPLEFIYNRASDFLARKW